jgi:Ulp1 family protease
VATLRDYLSCEFKSKLKEERHFTKESMPGCCPKVPQQPNFSDCGVFVLEYVESFFMVTAHLQLGDDKQMTRED